MKTTARARALDATRKAIGAASGPLLARRYGRFYLARRYVEHRLEHWTEAGATPAFVDVPIGEIEAGFPGSTVHVLRAATTTAMPDPRVHTDRDWVFRVAPPPGVLRTPPVQVLDLTDAVLYGSDGMPGFARDHLVAEFPTVFHLPDRHLRRRNDVARRLGRRSLPGTTVSLLQHSIGNYSHWLTQGIPRLDFVRSVVDLDEADRILVNSEAPAATFAALDALGVDPARVERVPEPAPVLACDRLVLATPAPEMAALPDWSRAFLRSLFLDRVPAGSGSDPGPAPRRLLVVRPPTGRRRVVNADAVRRVLDARGFTALAMEGRSVREQAALFAGAEWVVAEHGAALANLAFATPGARVVELMGVNSMMWMFPAIGFRAGLEHDVLIGTEPAPPPRWWQWRIDADQIVDVDRLAGVIDGR